MKSSAEGRFSLPPQEQEEYVLIVEHARGFRIVTAEQFSKSRELTVQEWGRVEGKTHLGDDRPEKDMNMRLEYVDFGALNDFQIQADQGFAKLDEEGSFIFDRLLPGDVRIIDPQGGAQGQYAEVRSGQTTMIEPGY